MKSQEMWVQVDSEEELDEVQRFILYLGEEQLLGEIPVMVYSRETRRVLRLSSIYDVSEQAFVSLVEKYGEDNVKLIEKKDLPEYEGRQGEPKSELMERIATNLDRLADALEQIEMHLDCLSDCINERNQFCITGGITTYEP